MPKLPPLSGGMRRRSAEPGDEAEYELRIKTAQGGLVDAEPLLHARTHIDDKRVGMLDERMQQLESGRRRVVQGDAALVPVVGLEMRARQAAGEPAKRVAAFR